MPQVVQEIAQNSLGIPISIKSNYNTTGCRLTLLATPPGGTTAQAFTMTAQSDNATGQYITGTKTAGQADFTTSGDWQVQMKIENGTTIRFYTTVGILRVLPNVAPTA